MPEANNRWRPPRFNNLTQLDSYLQQADFESLLKRRVDINLCALEGAEKLGRGSVVVFGSSSPSDLEPSIFYLSKKDVLDRFGYLTSVVQVGQINDGTRRRLRQAEEKLHDFREALNYYDPSTEFVLFVYTDVDNLWSVLLRYPNGLRPNLPPEL